MMFRALARGTRTRSRLMAGASSWAGRRRFSMPHASVQSVRHRWGPRHVRSGIWFAGPGHLLLVLVPFLDNDRGFG